MTVNNMMLQLVTERFRQELELATVSQKQVDLREHQWKQEEYYITAISTDNLESKTTTLRETMKNTIQSDRH